MNGTLDDGKAGHRGPAAGRDGTPRILHARSAAPLNPAKITIRDLDFFCGSKQALRGVSLDLPARQVTGLIGPSGCGKSTLLRVLDRLYDLYPDQRVTGQVRMDGEDILRPDLDVCLPRSRIGIVFQELAPFPMSVYGNVAFGTSLHETLRKSEMDARVEECLTRAGLWAEVRDRLDSPAAGLSGGQQQRLCIARTIATRPEAILLDEPTSALDPANTRGIEELIGELKQDLMVVIVTHDREQAARCADQVAFFCLGEMLEAGPAAQMFTAPKQARTQDYLSGRFG